MDRRKVGSHDKASNEMTCSVFCSFVWRVVFEFCDLTAHPVDLERRFREEFMHHWIVCLHVTWYEFNTNVCVCVFVFFVATEWQCLLLAYRLLVRLTLLYLVCRSLFFRTYALLQLWTSSFEFDSPCVCLCLKMCGNSFSNVCSQVKQGVQVANCWNGLFSLCVQLEVGTKS